MECLEWDGRDLRTMLYLIALNGIDPSEGWDMEDLQKLVINASHELVSEEKGTEDMYAVDLIAGLRQIFKADALHTRRTLAKNKKSK